jgi:hypothetical protein
MKTIELVIDDQLLERVNTIAASQNRTIQELLIKLLNSLDGADTSKHAIADEPEYDPITPLIGSLHLNTNDLAENHDHYIGQALHREMKGDK